MPLLVDSFPVLHIFWREDKTGVFCVFLSCGFLSLIIKIKLGVDLFFFKKKI